MNNAPQPNILDEIGSALGRLFANAFETPNYPGYKWDALQGWVPDGSSAAAPAKRVPSVSVPNSAMPTTPLNPAASAPPAQSFAPAQQPTIPITTPMVPKGVKSVAIPNDQMPTTPLKSRF